MENINHILTRPSPPLLMKSIEFWELKYLYYLVIIELFLKVHQRFSEGKI